MGDEFVSRMRRRLRDVSGISQRRRLLVGRIHPSKALFPNYFFFSKSARYSP